MSSPVAGLRAGPLLPAAWPWPPAALLWWSAAGRELPPAGPSGTAGTPARGRREEVFLMVKCSNIMAWHT